jgi:hypothetical protein
VSEAKHLSSFFITQTLIHTYQLNSEEKCAVVGVVVSGTNNIDEKLRIDTM